MSDVVPPKRNKLPSFLAVFCLHFILPNVLILIAALVTGAVGGEYGLPYLIWHDDPVKQFWVGFGLGVVGFEVLFVGFLLWAKKVARLDRIEKYPQILEMVGPKLFLSYCGWVLGQMLLVLGVLSLAILLVQFLDRNSRGDSDTPIVEAIADPNFLPPHPNYDIWLALGGIAAIIVVLCGGVVMRRWVLTRIEPGADNASRKILDWIIEAANAPEGKPPEGGLLMALWIARTQGSRLQRVFMALFNQMLCLSVGIVFAAAWELSNVGIAILVGGSMFLSLALVPARWMFDRRVFRVFILSLIVLTYFEVTWLGSKSWCGWPWAFLVLLAAIVIFPIGVRYAFPGPTAKLIRTTHERVIAPELCRKYPFHFVGLMFFLFGALTLCLLPLAFTNVSSPMILASYLIFLVVAVYGFIAYAVDDALPYIAPAGLICVVLSGLPQYKMRFPGLEYSHDDDQVSAMLRIAQRFKLAAPEEDNGTPVATGSPLLDLERATIEDLRRQRAFDQAVARAMETPFVVVGRNGTRPEDVEAERLWLEMEQLNRVLPGKDRRERVTRMATPANLLMSRDIGFQSVPASIEKLQPLKTVVDDKFPDTGKKPMVIVVSSGGGVRAAAWTFVVLSELERRFAQENIPFPYHIRMMTGASGGMFGNSYYVSSLKAPGRMGWGADRAAELRTRYDRLTQDWLTPIVESLVLNDIPSFFSPFSTVSDRGIALEKAWSKGLDGELDVTFKELEERERAGWCPSLVFTPMMIEDGRRLLISNLDMRYPASNDGHLLDYDPERPETLKNYTRNYSHEAAELFRMFPQSKDKFALSTAVRMSASFPYFSPAVPLPTKPRRRVVDAGYFDNYGVSLAASYLFSKKNAEWFAEHVSKIVIVQIRDGQSEDERRLEAIPDTGTRKKGLSSLLSRSLEEITSPIEGLNNGRVGTCSFRNDGLLELLSTYFERERGEPGPRECAQARRFFTVVNFEYPGHVALSWHLAKSEKEQILSALSDPQASKEVRSKIESLLEWWKSDVWTPPAKGLTLRD
jgi:hypothetical protein